MRREIGQADGMAGTASHLIRKGSEHDAARIAEIQVETWRAAGSRDGTKSQKPTIRESRIATKKVCPGVESSSFQTMALLTGSRLAK